MNRLAILVGLAVCSFEHAAATRFSLSYTPYAFGPNSADEFMDMPFRLEYFPQKRASFYFSFLFDTDVFEDNVKKDEGYKRRFKHVMTSELALGAMVYPLRNKAVEFALGAGYLHREEEAVTRIGGWEERERYLYEEFSDYVETCAALRITLGDWVESGWMYTSYKAYGEDSRYDFGMSYQF